MNEDSGQKIKDRVIGIGYQKVKSCITPSDLEQ